MKKAKLIIKKRIIFIAIMILSLFINLVASAEETASPDNQMPDEVQSLEPEPIPEENNNEPPVEEPAVQPPIENDSSEPLVTVPTEEPVPPDTTDTITTIPETSELQESETVNESVQETETESEPEKSGFDSETIDLLKQYLTDSVSDNNAESESNQIETSPVDASMEKIISYLDDFKTYWISFNENYLEFMKTNIAIGCVVIIGIGLIIGIIVFRRWH